MMNRSKTLIELTNILDRTFPEFKPFLMKDSLVVHFSFLRSLNLEHEFLNFLQKIMSLLEVILKVNYLMLEFKNLNHSLYLQ